jgi:hypothetical protein
LKGAVKINKAFDEFSAKVIVENETKNTDAKASLKFGHNENLVFSTRTTHKHNNWRGGKSLRLDLNALNLLKYNVFTSYRHKDHQFYFEHLSQDSTKVSLGHLVFSWLGHCKKTKSEAVASVTVDTHNKENHYVVGG